MLINKEFYGVDKIYNTALIGGGKITEYYQIGLKQSDNIRLVALCDKNNDCLAKSLYPDARFYSSISKMLKAEYELDLAIVSVGANQHEEVVCKLLENNISVICEKPPCFSLEALNKMYQLADEHNVTLDFMYHFECGDEMKWLVNNIAQFGQIEYIHAELHEQYASDEEHIVQADRVSLGDSWFDAASNSLSDIWHLMDIKNCEKTREILDYDEKNNVSIYAHKTFKNKYGQEFDILIDWMTRNKTKITTIKTDQGVLLINHHDQVITFNDEVIYAAMPNTHRMNVQYTTFFKHFKHSEMNKRKTEAIMNILVL